MARRWSPRSLAAIRGLAVSVAASRPAARRRGARFSAGATSWLSRESHRVRRLRGRWRAVGAAAFWFAPLADRFQHRSRVAAAVAGLLGVFCSAMIYVDTRREFWSASQCFAKFFGTTLLLGAASALACARADCDRQSPLCAAIGALRLRGHCRRSSAASIASSAISWIEDTPRAARPLNNDRALARGPARRCVARIARRLRASVGGIVAAACLRRESIERQVRAVAPAASPR